MAVDQQGHVYIGGEDDIHRLSPDGTFRDIVLSKHEQFCKVIVKCYTTWQVNTIMFT
jgi:sugar lactone lactonase YvrE